jgi:pimeloyl-ACP methyl ester carboxylesterase
MHGTLSDKNASKSLFLEDFCRRNRIGYTAFDFTGHGDSSGEYTDGTIGIWLNDALEIIDRITAGDLILVGSSMGGWIALLAAKLRPDRVKAVVGLAAAADFTVDVDKVINGPAAAYKRIAATLKRSITRPVMYCNCINCIVSRVAICFWSSPYVGCKCTVAHFFFAPFADFVSSSPRLSTATFSLCTIFVKNPGSGTPTTARFSSIDISSLIISHIETMTPKR